MLCERCHSREATVHSIIVNGDARREEHLCEECAAKLSHFQFAPELNFHKIFPQFFTPQDAEAPETGKTCPHCSQTAAAFRKTGKPGCPECYKVFGDEIKPLLSRIHGSQTHRGKAPENLVSKDKLADLRSRLQILVAEENYEEAARVRDEIRSLEQVKAGDTHE